MTQKTIKITAWSLTVVVGLLLALSASLKIIQSQEALTHAAALGIDSQTYFILGIIEIASLILFIIPRTAILGTLLLIAYMGGAIATHLVHQQAVIVPAAVQILIWITAAVRFPELSHRISASK